MNRILLYLGLNPTGFRAGLKQATDETRQFERGWKGLFKIFAAGGATTLVLGFLRSLVDHARESSDAIESNTQAVIRFGNAWDNTTKNIKDAGVSALGFVATTMEGVAFQLGRLVYGSDAVVDAMNDMALATAKAVDADRTKKLEAAQKSLGKTVRDNAYQEADNQGKINLLLSENIKLRQDLAKTQEGTVKRVEAQEALEKNLAEIRKVSAAITRDEEQTQKRVNEELEKFFGDVEKGARKRQELAERLKEIEFERLPLSQQVESLAKSESALQDKILAAKRAGRDTLQLQVDQAEIQLVLEAKRKELSEQQLSTEEKKTTEMKKQAAVMGFMVRGFAQFEDASDAALRDLIAKNQSLIAARQFKLQLSPNDPTTRMDLGRIQQESANARQELAFREGLRRDIAIGGEALARRNFKGDPLQFDEVLQRVQGNWEKQDEANDLLRDIKTGLTSRDQRLAELPDQVRSLTAATQAVAVQLNQRGLRSS
jgi:hypothetical protein